MVCKMIPSQQNDLLSAHIMGQLKSCLLVHPLSLHDPDARYRHRRRSRDFHTRWRVSRSFQPEGCRDSSLKTPQLSCRASRWPGPSRRACSIYCHDHLRRPSYDVLPSSKYDRTPSKDEPNTGKRNPSAASRHNSRPVVKRASGTLPLNGDNGRAWFGVVSIGTPPVNFVVDIDTCGAVFFI